MYAAKNPLDASHMVLRAGNDALRTVKATRVRAPAEYVLVDDGNPLHSGFVGPGAGVLRGSVRPRSSRSFYNAGV